MIGILTSDSRKPGLGDAERAQLHKSMLAYSGRYRVEGNQFVTTVDVSWNEAWNGTEQLMLGLDPNPGVGSFGTLLDFDLTGPSIWGGSEEGLNASLAMSVALAVLLVPLVLAVRRQISKTA